MENTLRIHFRNLVISTLVILNSTFVGIAFGADQFSAEIMLKEVKDEFSDDVKYQPIRLILNDTNDFCESGSQCSYEISDGELTQNSYDSTLRSFDGTLKVIVQQGDTKVTKLFPFTSELSISEIRETGGQSLELLDGKISFGKDIFNPDFEYGLSNGTLSINGQEAVLRLSGNSTTF